MECGDFLAAHSEFRDGVLSRDAREAFAYHLARCERCARYDRVVRQGVEVFRSRPQIEVSDDFAERLQHRLHHERDAHVFAPRRGYRPAALAGLAVAATVAGLTVAPLVQRPASVGPGPIAVESSAERVAVDEARHAPVDHPVRAAATFLTQERGLVAKLEEVGVAVYPLPYRDVRARGAFITMAAYDAHAFGND